MSATDNASVVPPQRVFLGVHDGHNASVALVRGGRIELALQEERLSRVKNQGDAPALAARIALDRVGTTGLQQRHVALNGHYMNYSQWDRDAVVRDYRSSASFRSRCKQPFKGTMIDRVYQSRKASARRECLDSIGFSVRDQVTVEHHRAHAAAAYFTAPFPEVRAPRGKILVLTCDGSGDRLSATVSVGESGVLTRLAEVSEHDSIGRLYSLVTRYLGMQPLEHEYKVMGLAPYAAGARESADIAKKFEDMFEFPHNSMTWRRRPGVPSMYSGDAFLSRLLAGRRFDWIAAGAQTFVERMLTRWVRNAIRETGIGSIACSGGVFMNVKANLAILELPEVERMFVFPSCGDESNSIGAACFEAARAGEKIAPLGPMYFGEPISDREAELALEAAERGGHRIRFQFEPDIERVTAGNLAKGRIVGRVKGAMEFGARALGNRSILGPADKPGVVRTINSAIKSRDFWMPFAPSVTAERSAAYVSKPKSVDSPHMMFAFRSRSEKRAAFGSAQHPCDFTARLQEVSATDNPDYHRMLQEYEALTGEAIVLNTSFNLHGEPIVYRASDAVDVFLRSGLEHMALGNWRVEKKSVTILVTGAAGFIGYHACQRLLGQGKRVVGLDNLNAYYDPALKRARLERLAAHPRFRFLESDLAVTAQARSAFAGAHADVVLHLAAQAGVRYSLENPHAYTEANITGFLNVLEGCRHERIGRLIYASSSSVYGGNRKIPFAVGDPVDTPVSLYAATKRANELMAYSYTHLFGFAATGLRFFTVYGPWGRPDMAPFRFAEAIDRGGRIDIYNYGHMQRDFTYVDDVAEGLVRVIERPHEGHRIYNIGNDSPVGLLDFVHAMERAFGKRARRRFLPMQPGDVAATQADVEDFWRYTQFRPETRVEEGVERFVHWYRFYYGRGVRARVA